MSKKLLEESTIRRFGGLAGIKPATTSNFLGEMGDMGAAYDRDDEEVEMEMGDEEVEMDVEEEPVEDEMALEEPAEDSDAAEDLVVSLLDKVKEWASEQGVDMDVEEEAEEAEMEMDMEMDVEEEGGEEEVEMGEEEELTLEEMINAVLSETEEEVIEEETEEEVIEEETEEEVIEEEAEETQETQTLDTDNLVQEISKRVRSRLAEIAKLQRQNK